jgi:flagellar hook-length control protein FliK
LLGVGLSTSSDHTGTNKSPRFAEDLRLQISEAVASSRSRQLQANQPATESQHQKEPLPDAVEAAPSTLAADATLPLSTEPQADLNTDNRADDGSLLPPPDQSLPVISLLPLADLDLDTGTPSPMFSPFLQLTSLTDNKSLLTPEVIGAESALPPIFTRTDLSKTTTDPRTLQLTTDLPEIMLDLQTKHSETENNAANRSAYVNSLIASLMGNSTDNQQATSLVDDYNNQSMLLMPTISSMSDQQLLANVAALASEPSLSSQGATLYNADQRLQQAAEARLAHLQGLQNNNADVDITTARSSGTMLASLDASFGQAGWAERIGRQILLQSAQGSSSAQIQLDPPELGSLMIKLQLVDQTATVNFVSPHAMVRDALEQQAGRLQEMFREQGMSLLDVSVSDQSANSRQDSERQTTGRDNLSNPAVVDSAEPENLVSVRQSSSLVDYYA